jgi:predicted RNase H-like HicB family nuclease
MTTRDFKVFLEPDADYGGYVVVCPSIPGCYSQGKTVPEALANIREAIDLCIEDNFHGFSGTANPGCAPPTGN